MITHFQLQQASKSFCAVGVYWNQQSLFQPHGSPPTLQVFQLQLHHKLLGVGATCCFESPWLLTTDNVDSSSAMEPESITDDLL